MGTVLKEQSPKKILDIKAGDANFKEEMPHLMLCGTDSGTTTAVCETSLQGNTSTNPPTPQGLSLNLMNKQSSIILQSMGQSIHIVDHNGLIVYWNAAAERLFGYSKSEALGRSPLDLIIEECDYNKATEIICRSSIGQIWTGNFPVTNKNGRRFLGFGTTTPFRGVFVGVICISLDSQPFHEAQTLYSAGTFLSLEAAYPNSSEFSKSGPSITTGLDSQEKYFQTSRMINKIWEKMRTCMKTMKQDTQVGDRPYFDHQGSSETVCSDDREDFLEEISPAKLFRDFADESEGKFGICKMIVSSVMGMLLPWKGREQDGSITRTTAYCGFLSLNKMTFFNKRAEPAKPNKVVKNNLSEASSYSSCYLKPNRTSNVDRSSSSSSSSSHHRFNIEVGSLKLDISWEDLTFGSCATVYQGRWCGSDVAIKVFSEVEHSDDLLRSFRREVLLMKKLRHPNVLLFMGPVTSPRHLCIVTEFLPRCFDRKTPKLDWKLCVLMTLDIARCMNYLHRYNPPVVHRDLKSSNLLVDKNWIVKVGDFGLSRLKYATYLTTKSGKGTPQWMSPEVIRNEPADEKKLLRSDVYSFGAILWELATLKIPWDDLNSMQVIAAVGFMDQQIEIPKDTDPQWASLVESCWHRYKKTANIGELLEKLKILQRYYFAKPRHDST
ncbi:hypothetical protein MKX01_003210 [Papaver californicum]|nr:hypothetical protein MKX01_003210 [Papaver californicum]